MASLKNNNLASSQSTLGRWKGKPVIYVEGESDQRIFENYWFTELLDKVSFDTATHTHGCTAVVNAVAADRQQGIAAFGIVDRDKLMSDDKWQLLRETDDEVFENARPYPEIKVTIRWELESYLIEPDAIESFLAPAQKGRVKRPTHEVVADLLDHADALIPLSALNQALHLYRKPARGDGYADDVCRAQVETKIASDHATTPFPADVWASYRSNLPLIEAFSGSAAIPPATKLAGLLRAINGKAMLHRIKKAAGIRDDITYHLADKIKQAGVPGEIDSFIRQCFA